MVKKSRRHQSRLDRQPLTFIGRDNVYEVRLLRRRFRQIDIPSLRTERMSS